jgi:hypothetical protein
MTEIKDEHAWTCGSRKDLECRRFIDRGAFGEVYEVFVAFITATNFFRSPTKMLHGLGSKQAVQTPARSLPARYFESTTLLKRRSELKQRILI